MNKLMQGIITTFCIAALCSPGFAQEAEESEGAQELKLPEDLTIVETDKYQLQEQRIGGRLDRVTVNWNNGITEVYQNSRDDTIWFSEEEDLGDKPNVRQWRLGSW